MLNAADNTQLDKAITAQIATAAAPFETMAALAAAIATVDTPAQVAAALTAALASYTLLSSFASSSTVNGWELLCHFAAAWVRDSRLRDVFYSPAMGASVMKCSFFTALLLVGFSASVLFVASAHKPLMLKNGEFQQSRSGDTLDASQAVNVTMNAAPWAAAHVSNLASLKALLPAGYTSVFRDGFTIPGDGGQALYTYTSAACPINSGAGDNGGQVRASGRGCWNIAPQPAFNLAIWGVSQKAADNAPFIDAAYRWARATGYGAVFRMDGGTYNLASTFDCHYASGTTLEGAGGGATRLYRTANYGHTMTCGGAQTYTENITIKNIFAQQDIGDDPTTGFINPTTGFGIGYDAAGSAHFAFRNISHATFDHVLAWNMNFNIEIIDCINVDLDTDGLVGFWDGIHDQTKANLYIDGADGDYNIGHPQLVHVHNLLTTGFHSVGPKTFGSGWTANTVPSFTTEKGAYDDILVKSIEGLTIDGGGAAIGAYNANLELRPQGVAGKYILQVRTSDYWMDGAGSEDVLIDNSDILSCTAPNSIAVNVQFNGGLFNGEYSTPYAIYVPQNSCNSVSGLQINNVTTVAHINDTYKLGGVSGGILFGGSAKGYNAYGFLYYNAGESSAAFIFGGTSSFNVVATQIGGGNEYEEPVTAIGVASVSSGGTGFAPNATGTLTWNGSGCTTNPVVSVSSDGSGTITTTGIMTGGSCQMWPTIYGGIWTPGGAIGTAGATTTLAVGPAYTSADLSMFGITYLGAPINVRRFDVQNIGYYEDFATQMISCDMGAAAPLYGSGSDNAVVVVTTNGASGTVTSGTCSFNGRLAIHANIRVTASDAQTAAGVPIAAAITSTSPTSFNFSTASSIGNGGKITFTIAGGD